MPLLTTQFGEKPRKTLDHKKNLHPIDVMTEKTLLLKYAPNNSYYLKFKRKPAIKYTLVTKANIPKPPKPMPNANAKWRPIGVKMVSAVIHFAAFP